MSVIIPRVVGEGGGVQPVESLGQNFPPAMTGCQVLIRSPLRPPDKDWDSKVRGWAGNITFPLSLSLFSLSGLPGQPLKLSVERLPR